ncbi:MAG: hypothetical protein K8U03_01475 [Planctomycetia bacterium]|nr:hypothetical protein [Planctomycetia bacterium]
MFGILLFGEVADVDPHGLKLWLVFIAVWVTFWATVGGIVCHKLKRRGLQGALLGAGLAVIGIMLVLLQEDPPTDPPQQAPT